MRIDISRRNTQGLHFSGIQIHPDFTVHATVAVNATNARKSLHLTFHNIIDIPRQLFQRHARSLHGIGLD